jgi:aryl-alcohol dehydrogenase-like predicted oxidoreductase
MACDKFADHLFRIARRKSGEIEMRLVRLGRNGPGVSEMGLGCMGMSGGYGHAGDAESIVTIHAALEAGITMLDIGDFYGAR